jgi:hypothetical protein
LPPGYALWQERLSAEFFFDRPGQPVVLFVDRDELDDLAGNAEDGARSLASAVLELVDVERGAMLFARVQQAERAWRGGTRNEPPPTLPVLALSVLAASEMHSDDEGARHNYYIRLARALLPDAQDAEVADLRTVLRDRHAFVAVATMWKQLNDWLTERAGASGISTIRQDTEWTRIGYPLSQTLVRRSDRSALTRFFARLNLKPEGLPGPDSLMNMLRLWAGHRGHGLSDRFVDSLSDGALIGYLTPLIHELAKAWDGKIVTPEGLRRLELRLAVDLDEGKAWWVIPSLPDIPNDLLTGTSDGQKFEALIALDPNSSMYHAQGLPHVTAAALTFGVSARGERSFAEYQASKVVVLADTADAGGWMSVDAVRPYEEHVFIATSEVAAAVGRALDAAADAGWRQLPPQTAARLVGAGYVIFGQVVFSAPDRLDAAIATLPGGVATSLRLGTTARPRLINGLPLLRSLTRNLYLTGGEPDLVLPVGAEPRDVTVTLDGMADRLRASIFPFPFRRFGPYEEGPHTVEADDEKLTFVTAPSTGDDRIPDVVGSLGWCAGTLCESRTDATVCGAVTASERVERPVLAKRGSSETWIIAATGQMTQLAEPAAPIFLAELNFPLFEVDRDRGAWLAQKRAAGWTVTRMSPLEPAFRGLTADDRLLWDELAAAVASNDRLWAMYCDAWYCDAWERLRGR